MRKNIKPENNIEPMKNKFIYFILLLSIFCSCQKTVKVHVDNTENLSKAIAEAKQLLVANNYPEKGITIEIAPGQYTIDKTIELDHSFSFPTDAPLSIVVKNGGKAIFDGGKAINTSNAEKVKGNDAKQLNPKSRGKVYQLKVSDKALQELLKKENANISINGQMMSISRYPNAGYAHFDKILEKGAEYAHGRTLGAPPTYSQEKPIGGVFTVLNKDVSQWEEELKHTQKARVTGYLSYDWYKQNHKIASVTDGKVKLLEYSRYGIIQKEHIPRRFFVKNLLCELDKPGEFYYDNKNNELYFWPVNAELAQNKMTAWAGNAFIKMNGAANIRFENLEVVGVAKGNAVVDLKNCENVKFSGCIVHNCSTAAFKIDGGYNNGIESCDIYDVPHHVTLIGGNRDELAPSHNYARNCHFTQVEASDFYGRIIVNGVGQIFENNLVHNFIGQVMNLDGNDHLIQNNEFFNIGIEEGDGGAIYSGAQMFSWGNVLKNNFLHHLICIPEAHPRGGIYPDDRDQGDSIVNNVFYKAAHRSVLINGGAGHTVNSNLFLNGYIGVYNKDTDSKRMFDMQKEYDEGRLKRGDKMDYIWKTEQVVGKEGWNKEPWLSKYPKFAKIMNQELRRFYPIECEVSNNCFYSYKEKTMLNTRDENGKNVRIPFEESDYFKAENNVDITLDIFQAPEDLNFAYKASESKLPKVDFNKIGLYKDEFRTTIPNKANYRNKVKSHFEDIPSYNPDAKYNPETINEQLYFNTGKLILNM